RDQHQTPGTGLRAGSDTGPPLDQRRRRLRRHIVGLVPTIPLLLLTTKMLDDRVLRRLDLTARRLRFRLPPDRPDLLDHPLKILILLNRTDDLPTAGVLGIPNRLSRQLAHRVVR